MNEPEKYYSIPEAAKICGVSRTSMWNWVKSGHIEAFVTPGGHHRILQKDIDRILKENKTSAAEPKKILIVDDDPKFVKFLKIRLERYHLHVETTGDGFEAGMKILQLRPDLVVLDLFMPGIDGFDVCRKIRKNSELKNTRVLAVTGFDTPENRRQILETGADDYLSKSEDPAVLIQRIRYLADGKK
ncbi:MAG: response regulator [Desulfococcaceae bacterium]|jgi:excisionase family DNA binding protein|nr:response regulator [Desulfococcaceae bacterium]